MRTGLCGASVGICSWVPARIGSVGHRTWREGNSTANVSAVRRCEHATLIKQEFNSGVSRRSGGAVDSRNGQTTGVFRVASPTSASATVT